MCVFAMCTSYNSSHTNVIATFFVRGKCVYTVHVKRCTFKVVDRKMLCRWVMRLNRHVTRRHQDNTRRGLECFEIADAQRQCDMSVTIDVTDLNTTFELLARFEGQQQKAHSGRVGHSSCVSKAVCGSIPAGASPSKHHLQRHIFRGSFNRGNCKSTTLCKVTSNIATTSVCMCAHFMLCFVLSVHGCRVTHLIHPSGSCCMAVCVHLLSWLL